MTTTLEEMNKALVLEAFDTLFNKRDYKAAARLWSPNYIQHSAHIPPGREGLFSLIKSAPPTLRYESGVILADKEFVIVHGRFSGRGGPRSWIAADIVRIADGVLAEHWDVTEHRQERRVVQDLPLRRLGRHSPRSDHLWRVRLRLGPRGHRRCRAPLSQGEYGFFEGQGRRHRRRGI